jgi:hypothetical protein
VKWADYSGALPILLPLRIASSWHGFYLPVAPGELPDLETPDGEFKMCQDYDFVNPKTDYDRACALGGSPAIQTISVGAGTGLVFATELDAVTWWADRKMIVNGGAIPSESRLPLVKWRAPLNWVTSDSQFLLMNACDHGAAPAPDTFFEVQLTPGEYSIRAGSYGWAGDEDVLILFQFVKTPETSKERLTVDPVPE